MSKRNRFVRAEKTRLALVDVHRSAHQDLITKGFKISADPEKYRPATSDEIAASYARVQQSAEDGDWVDLKTRLTAGEAREMYTNVIKGHELRQGESVVLDPARVGVTTILTYLLGWSFQEDGEAIPYSVVTMGEDERLATILRLSPEDYQELDQAVDYHAALMAAAREAEKNAPAMTSTSAPIS